MTKMRCLLIGKDIFEYPGESRLANTSVTGNMVSGVTIGGKGNDVFLVSSRNGVHIRSRLPWHVCTAYIALMLRYHYSDNSPSSVSCYSH